MYKYKIKNITDKDGNKKVEFIEKMKMSHPSLSGKILYPDFLMPGTFLMLVWDDDSGKMLRTSIVEKITGKCVAGDQILTITTRNSIYTLKRIMEETV